MVKESNKLFWGVYNKAQNKLEKVSKRITNHYEFGSCKNVSKSDQKKFIAILEYLEVIKLSKYEYFHINGLTKISNILNTI